ncbi:hypothetical protein ACQU0X_32770 [Pseudovibrio ascidiaceicola]|uniref:hypothetical protein n=1 Tax=Pseudovibrio ascidiaceicola TaxID=285279 RepID=UPI003D35DEDB
MSIFDRAERIGSRAVDAVMHDGSFTVYPQTKATTNSRASSDPDRGEFSGRRCILSLLSIESGIELGVRKTYRESNDFRTVSIGRDFYVSIDKANLGGNEMKQGDFIHFASYPKWGRFKLFSVKPDGKSRIKCDLIAMDIET